MRACAQSQSHIVVDQLRARARTSQSSRNDARDNDPTTSAFRQQLTDDIELLVVAIDDDAATATAAMPDALRRVTRSPSGTRSLQSK